MVTMYPVQSSTIKSLGWDAATSVLFVSFNDGSNYSYVGVSEAVFRALLAADSIGRYFAKNIRDRYPTRKL